MLTPVCKSGGVTGDRRAVLDQLRQIPHRQAALDRAEHTLLTAARRSGASWSEVAAVLGLGSRQAAEQRFRRLRERLFVDDGAAGAPAAGQGAAEPDHAHGVTTRLPIGPDPHEPDGDGRSTPAVDEPHRRLVLSTAELLEERGYAATRVSDIVGRAEVSPGSLYHRFTSKEELMEHVLRFAVIAAHQRVARDVAAVPTDGGPAARLAAAMEGHLRVNVELGVISRAHAHAYGHAPRELKDRLRPLRRRYGALWSELIGAAADDGMLRPDIDRYLLRLFVVQSIEAASEWAWRAHRSTGELAATITRLILEGAGAPIPSRTG